MFHQKKIDMIKDPNNLTTGPPVSAEEAAQAIVDLRRYVLELRRLVAIGSGNSFDIDGARLQLDVAEVHLHTIEKMVRKEVEDGKVTG